MSKPDYIIKVKERDPEEGKEARPGGRVGVGWRNEDSSISIQIDPGVVLDYRLSADHLITLFPPFNKASK